MQKVITHSKIKLFLEKTPKEVLQIWKEVQGMWKKKKIEPIQYLKESRKEWKKRIS